MQVFTSLNDSVLTDVMDPISATDGVNKRYLEKRMDEHSREVVEKVLTVMVTLVKERANGDTSFTSGQEWKDMVLKRVGLDKPPEGIKESEENKEHH